MNCVCHEHDVELMQKSRAAVQAGARLLLIDSGLTLLTAIRRPRLYRRSALLHQFDVVRHREHMNCVCHEHDVVVARQGPTKKDRLPQYRCVFARALWLIAASQQCKPAGVRTACPLGQGNVEAQPEGASLYPPPRRAAVYEGRNHRRSRAPLRPER